MRSKLLAALSSLVVCACSNAALDAELPGSDDIVTDIAAQTDTTTDVQPADLPAPDDADTPRFPEEIWDFATPDTAGPACDEGEGCFLAQCIENTDCQSGWCVQHMGEEVCSQACQEECPPGWSCDHVAGTDPDVVYICVSNHANLCRPCAAGADCTSAGGAEDACLDYEDEGSFCGSPCGAQGECPWGFSCRNVTTVDGVELEQCVNDAGACPCTATSVALGLWTPCANANDFGTCPGKRVCTDEGLGDCDALEPAAESCNGLDDDCDGDTDEPDMVRGDYFNLCHDGNPCTDDDCLGEDGCDNPAVEAGSCDDDDPCTVADHCEAGVCVADSVECDDDNPCTDNICTATGGCDYPPNAQPCDDLDPCTLGDECIEGECVGIQMPCNCQSDADCETLEDGDLCNGLLVCNTGELPYKCSVDPDTIVVCPEPEGVDAYCLQPACEPATGDCSLVPQHEGYLCENGDACTLNDKCVEGICAAGTSVVCNDGNPCTDDSCDPANGCVHSPNEIPCNDSNPCTTIDLCSGGECVGGQELDCDDNNPCTDDSCDPDAGCVHTANQETCDDADECTTLDHCSGGNCIPGGSLNCDDQEPCTTDFCLPVEGCQQEPAPGPCDDGDSCTLNDICKGGTCVGGPAPDCNDDNPCTADSCNGSGLCVHVPANDEQCDDANACTVGDHCDGGACVHGGLQDCSDDDVCTDNFCDPIIGCVVKLNQAPCDDNDPCTTSDTCALGSCVGGPEVICNDGNDCTDDSCTADSGCLFVPNTLQCDDGNACTTDDACSGGWCKGGQMADCNDGNLCTDDACDIVDGCVNLPNTNPCNDDNFCTVGDTCASGDCLPGADVPCDDGDFCNGDEGCNPDTGCVAGTPPVLDDQIDCTIDSCDSQLQEIVHAPNNDLCPLPGLCETSVCDPAQGCVLETTADCCGNLAVEEGEECDDGNMDDSDACVGCLHAVCGDGVLYVGEEDCEEGIMGGETCESQIGAGFTGELTCTACAYDITACIGPLGSQSNPAIDCKAIFDAGAEDGDGVYFLQHEGNPIKAWCDMQNGGWTMVTSWPHVPVLGVWGDFSQGLDDPGPGKQHALPFRSIIPNPTEAKLIYLGNDQTLSYSIAGGAQWQTSTTGARIQVSDGRYFIFENAHCAPGQGICIVNGNYHDGFNCDGDSGQISGQGLFNQCTSNEFCNCGTYGWKYDTGGCNATVCEPPEQVVVYLR